LLAYARVNFVSIYPSTVEDIILSTYYLMSLMSLKLSSYANIGHNHNHNYLSKSENTGN
jgi:hypothetical protein